jgi:hypothetical protein
MSIQLSLCYARIFELSFLPWRAFESKFSVFRSRAIRDVCERKKRFASEVIREECVFLRECFATTREKHRKGYGLRSVPKLLLSKS